MSSTISNATSLSNNNSTDSLSAGQISGNGNGNGNSSQTPGDISIRLAQLSEGWLELESDPGLFSLLISDFGCRGVEVEEIYDLARPFTGPDQQRTTVYGFIFLFNVVEERRTTRFRAETSPSSLLSGDYIVDQNFLQQMFFAYQKVPNSCATHAILSVLLNCPQLDIGLTLNRLKEYTKDMTPENKGFAIGNMAELAKAHNQHASPANLQRETPLKTSQNHSSSVRVSQRTPQSSSAEAFHFVSFVPIQGRLIELDGLKEFPIDHGPIEPGQCWTEKFRCLVRQRIETPHGVDHDIRYNLMAVIPSRYEQSERHIRVMERNERLLRQILTWLAHSSTYSVECEHSYSVDRLLHNSQVVGKHSLPDSYRYFDPSRLKIDFGHSASSKINQQQQQQCHSNTATTTSVPITPTKRSIDDNDDDDSPNAFSMIYNFIDRLSSSTTTNVDSEFDHQGKKFDSTSSCQSSSSSLSNHSSTGNKPNGDLENDLEEVEYYDDETETASQASSSYNFYYDDDDCSQNELLVNGDNHNITCNNFDQLADCSKNVDDSAYAGSTMSNKRCKVDEVSRFFVCKFECPSLDTSSTSTATVIQNEQTNSDDKPSNTLDKFERGTMFDVKKTEEPEANDKNHNKTSDQYMSMTSSLMRRLQQYQQQGPWSYSMFENYLKPELQRDLERLWRFLRKQLKHWRRVNEDEQRKREKYQLDDSRRVHDYDQFITSFLAMFFEQGLADQIVYTSDGQGQMLVNEPQLSLSPPVVNHNNNNIAKSTSKNASSKVSSKESSSFSLITPNANSTVNEQYAKELQQHREVAQKMAKQLENSLIFPRNISTIDSAATSTDLANDFLKKLEKDGDEQSIAPS